MQEGKQSDQKGPLWKKENLRNKKKKMGSSPALRRSWCFRQLQFLKGRKPIGKKVTGESKEKAIPFGQGGGKC